MAGYTPGISKNPGKGQLVLKNVFEVLPAAAGFNLAYVPQVMAQLPGLMQRDSLRPRPVIAAASSHIRNR